MKAKSLTLVVLLCFCRICPVSAQIQETFWHWQVIDTVRIYCVYDYVEYNVFRSNHLKEHELFCVEIGDRLSRYYSLKQLEGDSLFYTTPQAKRAVKEEPKKVETKKTEPKKVTTTKTEPKKVTTAKEEPKKVTTAKEEPKKVTTAKTEPKKVTTAKTEPKKVTTRKKTTKKLATEADPKKTIEEKK